jgi:hypothetical protein
LNPATAIAILNFISTKLQIPTIVTIRDTTYRLCASFDPTNAWVLPNTFILNHIPINTLCQPRLAYLKSTAKRKLSKKEKVTSFISHILRKWYDDKDQYTLNESSYNLDELWEWFYHIGNSNFRESLNILQNVLSSNHITAEEFLKHRATSPFQYKAKYDINIKRFKMAFINGANTYYYERTSNTNIVNLFDASSFDFYLHYTFRLKILQLLYKLQKFTIKDVIKIFTDQFNTTLILYLEDTLSLFNKKQLFALDITHSSTGARKYLYDGISFSDEKLLKMHCFIAPNGIFHHDFLIYDDIYLDEMKYATDHSDEHYKNIFRFSEKTPRERVRSTNEFISTINNEEYFNKPISSNLDLPLLTENILEKYRNRKQREGHDYDSLIGNH